MLSCRDKEIQRYWCQRNTIAVIKGKSVSSWVFGVVIIAKGGLIGDVNFVQGSW
jgi:hypothetical protein